RFLLQSQLYTAWYCHGSAAPTPRDPMGGAVGAGLTPLVAQLSAANTGTGTWEAGWEVVRLTEEHVVVQRDRLTVWVRPADCARPPGGSLTPGQQVCLRLSKESLGMSPGFYLALSDAPFPQGAAHPVVRWYWHLRPEGAVPLMHH